MTENLLFWVYIINAVILINHEIDSAYWQEWKLLNPKDENGINGFLILHFPMIFAVLYGLVLVENGNLAGLIISLFVGASGIFAFFFHFYHLKKGKQEFNTLISKTIIISTFLISMFQTGLTLKLMIE
jgi:hypothetical protein